MTAVKSKTRKAPKPVLLLAEDDVVVRLVLAQHLRSCGLIVHEAATAQEGKTVLLAGVKIDILLADAQLAGPISGFALAQWVRRHRPGVAVVLTGGLRSKAEAAADMCERAAKTPSPHNGDALADRIQKMLAERDRRGRKPSAASMTAPRIRARKTS